MGKENVIKRWDDDMKCFFRQNIKLILSFLVGMLCSSITVSAIYMYIASDVTFQSSNKDWKVDNVGAALNDLYHKQSTATRALLVGSGNIVYHSLNATSLANIPSQLAQGGNDYVSLQNNVFTVKKAGNYIIFYMTGSHMDREYATSYSGFINIYINGSIKVDAQQSYDGTICDSITFSLKVGDTIVGKYRSDGGDFYKRATYIIYYAG